MSAPALFANVVLAVYVFTRRHPDFMPSLAEVHRSALRPLLATGGAQTLLLLGELTILNSTNPLIADKLGLDRVAQYAVPFSMLMMVQQVSHGLVNAYMAAFSEASARQDWQWIRATFAKSCKKGLALMTVAGAGITLVGPWFITFWTHGKVTPDRTLLAAMSLYFVLKVLSLQGCVLFMALGMNTPKAIVQIFVAAAHILGFLALASHFGLLAIPLAGGAAYLIDALISRYVIWRRFISRVEVLQPA